MTLFAARTSAWALLVVLVAGCGARTGSLDDLNADGSVTGPGTVGAPAGYASSPTANGIPSTSQAVANALASCRSPHGGPVSVSTDPNAKDAVTRELSADVIGRWLICSQGTSQYPELLSGAAGLDLTLDGHFRLLAYASDAGQPQLTPLTGPDLQGTYTIDPAEAQSVNHGPWQIPVYVLTLVSQGGTFTTPELLAFERDPIRMRLQHRAEWWLVPVVEP